MADLIGCLSIRQVLGEKGIDYKAYDDLSGTTKESFT